MQDDHLLDLGDEEAGTPKARSHAPTTTSRQVRLISPEFRLCTVARGKAVGFAMHLGHLDLTSACILALGVWRFAL